jgi:hypothetical protein
MDVVNAPASRVAPALWQGAAPRPGEVLPFDLVVLCAEEHQLPHHASPFGPRAHVLRVPLDDSGRPPTQREVRLAFAAGRVVAKTVGQAWDASTTTSYRRHLRVLTTCMQGRNRSGLVNALALVELGMRPKDAIQAVRLARGPSALSNAWFVQLIHAAGGQRFPSAAIVGVPS